MAGDRHCRSRRAPLKSPCETLRRCCCTLTDSSPLAGARHAPRHARFAALRPRARRVLEVRTAARALFRLVAQAQAHAAHACRAHCVARWLSRQLLNITSWHFIVTFCAKIQRRIVKHRCERSACHSRHSLAAAPTVPSAHTSLWRRFMQGPTRLSPSAPLCRRARTQRIVAASSYRPSLSLFPPRCDKCVLY